MFSLNYDVTHKAKEDHEFNDNESVEVEIKFKTKL